MANFLTPGRTWWVSVTIALIVGAGGATAVTTMNRDGEDPCAAAHAANASAKAIHDTALEEWEKKQNTNEAWAAQQALEQANRYWAQLTSDSPTCFSPAAVAAARQHLATPRTNS